MFEKHNGSRTSEYRSWRHAKSRCHNPSNQAYSHYGGRGISMCDRWRYSFKAFLDDMGRKPTPKHSLDRIDNDGNYERSNCRWATTLEQGRNKRNIFMVDIGGVLTPLSQVSEKYGIAAEVIRNRVKRHPTVTDPSILLRPVEKPRTVLINGNHLTVSQLSIEAGVNLGTIRTRLRVLKWADDRLCMNRDARYKGRVYESGGLSMTIKGWSEKTGIQQRTIRSRIEKYGWPVEKAISKITNKRKEG